MRTCNRLSDESITQHLNTGCDRAVVLALKAIKDELIYINTNLKVIKTIESDRARPIIDNAWERIKKVQHALITNGSSTQKWEAMAWRSGCHPLQNRE